MLLSCTRTGVAATVRKEGIALAAAKEDYKAREVGSLLRRSATSSASAPRLLFYGLKFTLASRVLENAGKLLRRLARLATLRRLGGCFAHSR